MDFNLIPIEIKKMIVTHSDSESLKDLALTSKEMRDLAYEKLWSKPRFSWLKTSNKAGLKRMFVCHHPTLDFGGGSVGRKKILFW